MRKGKNLAVKPIPGRYARFAPFLSVKRVAKRVAGPVGVDPGTIATGLVESIVFRAPDRPNDLSEANDSAGPVR